MFSPVRHHQQDFRRTYSTVHRSTARLIVDCLVVAAFVLAVSVGRGVFGWLAACHTYTGGEGYQLQNNWQHYVRAEKVPASNRQLHARHRAQTGGSVLFESGGGVRTAATARLGASVVMVVVRGGVRVCVRALSRCWMAAAGAWPSLLLLDSATKPRLL